jgi:hypothetical protein
MTRLFVVGFSVGLFALLAATACGSRGPLDISVVEEALDSSVIDSSPPVDASDATAMDSPADHDASAADGPAEDGRPPRDAAADVPPNPINCATCVGQQCGTDVLACLQNTACRATLQCVITTCIGAGGGFNPQCFVMCANGDPQVIVDVVNIVQCIATNCGMQCVGIIPGGGGGGGGGRDG